MTASGKLEFSVITREQMEYPISMARREGWNPGLEDGEAFHAADPEGFIRGDVDGVPATCISAVAHGDDFGFIGFYIVRQDMRGHGLGMATWNHALARLDGRVLGLDAVKEQVDTYRRSGFEPYYTSRRWQGKGGGKDPLCLVPLSAVPVPLAADYDAKLFPARREAFLEAWTTRPGTVALALPGKKGPREPGGMAGFGVMRPCGIGRKIGPLYADTPEGALALYQGLVAQAPGEPIFLDVPDPNEPARKMAQALGMEEVFSTVRMYKGPEPKVDMDKLFGVMSFELG